MGKKTHIKKMEKLKISQDLFDSIVEYAMDCLPEYRHNVEVEVDEETKILRMGFFETNTFLSEQECNVFFDEKIKIALEKLVKLEISDEKRELRIKDFLYLEIAKYNTLASIKDKNFFGIEMKTIITHEDYNTFSIADDGSADFNFTDTNFLYDDFYISTIQPLLVDMKKTGAYEVETESFLVSNKNIVENRIFFKFAFEIEN